MTADSTDTARLACRRSGLSPEMEPIRFGENAVFRNSEGIVVRVSRAGQFSAAAREVSVSRWLTASDVPAVRAIENVEQPCLVRDRAVTFWHEIPEHRPGTSVEIAVLLHRLHSLTPPGEPKLNPLSPLVRLAERIEGATTLTANDRTWLRQRLAELTERYTRLPPGLPHSPIHGDAWNGNVVTTDEGVTFFLDLERFSIGPPEWDLVSTAVKHTTVTDQTEAQYQTFCAHYGYDVTQWPGFKTLRDIREFRVTCYAAQRAAEHPTAHREAALRLACLRGEYGPRPWPWKAVT